MENKDARLLELGFNFRLACRLGTETRHRRSSVYPLTGVYQEIVQPERLVFTSAGLDEEGNPLFEVLNTVTFAEHRGKTTLTLQARVVKSAKAAPYLEGMKEGWTQSLERLEERLTQS